MPEESDLELLRKSRASWQDEYGLRGPVSERKVTKVPAFPAFSLREISRSHIGDNPLEKRINPDGSYGPHNGGGARIYRMLGGYKITQFSGSVSGECGHLAGPVQIASALTIPTIPLINVDDGTFQFDFTGIHDGMSIPTVVTGGGTSAGAKNCNEGCTSDSTTSGSTSITGGQGKVFSTAFDVYHITFSVTVTTEDQLDESIFLPVSCGLIPIHIHNGPTTNESSFFNIALSTVGGVPAIAAPAFTPPAGLSNNTVRLQYSEDGGFTWNDL